MGSISGSYNSSTGVLTLSGTGTLDQYEAALRAVKYSKTNSDTTDRSFSFTVGSAIPYSGNGHYYEAVYVSGGITWTDAKAAAEAEAAAAAAADSTATPDSAAAATTTTTTAQ
jgi:hypothetical protein